MARAEAPPTRGISVAMRFFGGDVAAVSVPILVWMIF